MDPETATEQAPEVAPEASPAEEAFGPRPDAPPSLHPAILNTRCQCQRRMTVTGEPPEITVSLLPSPQRIDPTTGKPAGQPLAAKAETRVFVLVGTGQTPEGETLLVYFEKGLGEERRIVVPTPQVPRRLR